MDANDAAIRKYGYTREEFLNLKASTLVAKDDTEKAMALVKSLRENGKFVEMSFKHTTKNSETIDVITQGNEINFNGKRARLVLVTDVTERLKTEKENELNEQRFKARFRTVQN
ncbi:PAS domain S-box protein [Flavobacterium lindanitolerans]|nr:PAS domain S-box protein [Flavobacterium lindanitolerans]